MNATTFITIDDVKRANREAGFHWFSPDTMRFFSTRICGQLRGGRYFVTSERQRWDDTARRMYSVREAMPDGSIETVGGFQEYATRDAAIRAAKRLAAE